LIWSSNKRALEAAVVAAFVLANAGGGSAVTQGNGDLNGVVFFVTAEGNGDEGVPVVYKYDLLSKEERAVGYLPHPLLLHVGLSITSGAERIIGCVTSGISVDAPGVGVYVLERNTYGNYDLVGGESYRVPEYPYKSVYDEWENKMYVTCFKPVPLEEKDIERFGLQAYKVRAALAIIDLTDGRIETYDISKEGYDIGVTSITERGIYVGTYNELLFIVRGGNFSLKKAAEKARYRGVRTFPLVLGDENGFVVEGHRGRDETFVIHYGSFTERPPGGLGEPEFTIKAPKRRVGEVYQLTNVVSPYSGHCLFVKYFNDFDGGENVYWELVALDTASWETKSVFKKYGFNYLTTNPPFVFGWVAPEEENEAKKSAHYVHNNNFIYRPWSYGEE
jgi:hypothetical protein